MSLFAFGLVALIGALVGGALVGAFLAYPLARENDALESELCDLLHVVGGRTHAR